MADTAATAPTGSDATSTTDTAATTDTNTDAATTTDQLDDGGKKALDAERRARRDAEKATKAAQAELEKLRSATQTEQEKAIADAKAAGRSEAMQETGVKLVDAEVRAATAGRNVDSDALLEGLDRTKFLDDNGDPDREAIKAWVDRIAPEPEEPTAPGFPDLSQGVRKPAGATSNDPLLKALTDAVSR